MNSKFYTHPISENGEGTYPVMFENYKGREWQTKYLVKYPERYINAALVRDKDIKAGWVLGHKETTYIERYNATKKVDPKPSPTDDYDLPF